MKAICHIALCYTVLHFMFMAKPLKKKTQATTIRPETSSVRWSEEDWQLIERLQKATGIQSVADLARQGLRALAKKEGL